MAKVSPGSDGCGGIGSAGRGNGTDVSCGRSAAGPSPTSHNVSSAMRAGSSEASTGVSSRSMTMSRAPQLPRMCSSCAPREAVLIGTAMAPSQALPRMVSKSSARLPHMMATRSPALMPGGGKGGRLAGRGIAQSGMGECPPADGDDRPLAVAFGLAGQHLAAPCVATAEKAREANGWPAWIDVSVLQLDATLP